MGKEPSIAELAIASWRLERWLDNLVAERKMAAKSALRSIKKYLEASDIDIIDPIGLKFDPGLAIEVVNNEADDVDEEDLIIVETNSPIVKQHGAVIQYGRVILGTSIKQQKPNNEIRDKINTDEMSISDSQNSFIDNKGIFSPHTNIKDITPNQLYVNQDENYWLIKMEIKSQEPGYVTEIRIDTNIETKLLLFDEQVYIQYSKGLRPLNPFVYRCPVGSYFIKVPYQDVWYIKASPVRDTKCSDCYINIYPVLQPEQKVNMERRERGTLSEEKKNPFEKSIDNTSESAIIKNASAEEDWDTDRNNDTPSHTSAQQIQNGSLAQTTINVVMDQEKEGMSEEKYSITDKEAERLRKKNIASYNINMGLLTGALKQPYNKGKKKRH